MSSPKAAGDADMGQGVGNPFPSKSSPASSPSPSPSPSFDAAKWLFVSRRLAEQYPHIQESGFIQQCFGTVFPRHWQRRLHLNSTLDQVSEASFTSVRLSLEALLFATVLGVIALPPYAVDMGIEFVAFSTVLYATLGLRVLMGVSPVFVVLVCVGVLVTLHFLYYWAHNRVYWRRKEIIRESKRRAKIFKG